MMKNNKRTKSNLVYISILLMIFFIVSYICGSITEGFISMTCFFIGSLFGNLDRED